MSSSFSRIPMKRPSFTHSGLALLGPSRSESDKLASVQRLAGSRFLCGLSRADLEFVIGAATVSHFNSNSVVVNQEDPANRLFFLLKGSGRYFIHTHGGRKLLLIWLAPGEVFGGSALLEQPSRYLCGVEVRRGTEILVWTRETIRDLSSRYPRLLENALSIATDYLTWYLATHVALTCDSARQRVAQVLLNLARGIGEEVKGGISVAMTNEELANTSNVTLFTVSRLMAEWKRQGAILKKRGKVFIPRLQDLESAGEEKSDQGRLRVCFK